MQLGSYNFTHLKNGMVFIQIAGDGEGGEFWRANLPAAIQRLLNAQPTAQRLTVYGHAECDRLMLEFWRKNF